eukprot:14184444-Alexandrium_andersonii.AAC.1
MLPSVRHEGFGPRERGQRSSTLLTRSDRPWLETWRAAGPRDALNRAGDYKASEARGLTPSIFPPPLGR